VWSQALLRQLQRVLRQELCSQQEAYRKKFLYTGHSFFQQSSQAQKEVTCPRLQSNNHEGGSVFSVADVRMGASYVLFAILTLRPYLNRREYREVTTCRHSLDFRYILQMCHEGYLLPDCPDTSVG
jgi:hypothetical protein